MSGNLRSRGNSLVELHVSRVSRFILANFHVNSTQIANWRATFIRALCVWNIVKRDVHYARIVLLRCSETADTEVNWGEMFKVTWRHVRLTHTGYVGGSTQKSLRRFQRGCKISFIVCIGRFDVPFSAANGSVSGGEKGREKVDWHVTLAKMNAVANGWFYSYSPSLSPSPLAFYKYLKGDPISIREIVRYRYSLLAATITIIAIPSLLLLPPLPPFPHCIATDDSNSALYYSIILCRYTPNCILTMITV